MSEIYPVFNSLLNSLPPLALFICLVACIVFFIIVLLLGFLIGTLKMKSRMMSYGKEMRLDAVKRSRSVLLGQLGEQVAPFLPHFPCNPEDVRFIGKPIDFIAFSGMSCGEEGESGFSDTGAIDEILFIEVKTGNASLSAREKEIKKAVDEGRVRYVEYRIGS